ncbi:hypothetical protein MHB77_08820 [Paenibacillus sp. FSL K6-3166]|uniref:hypothetical protein n=1 Tax=unclassified Paenibacillus TaxID=185978 RepID=UPI000B9FF318|nr:hypothetical protein [Paenibacillus sp. VTT E-133291]MBY3618617.1 hypothetical protein [Acinetobacter sp. CUI P1]OZQ97261.1 hypothetical protein CA598_06810 [Paenibacillus sp. VTT E-133291]
MSSSGYEKILISFFKHYKVSYYLKKPSIKFACLHCGNECNIEIKTTHWNCTYCNNDGKLQQLISLADLSNTADNKKVYNPRDEKNKIIKELTRLNKMYGIETTKMADRISKLFDHLINELQTQENSNKRIKG